MASSVAEIFPQEQSMSISIYKVYRTRFYVLFLFSLLAFNQCLIWSTFSPIYESTEKYYHINESTIDLFLAWGPICFIPCLPLTYLLLNKSNGLRYCVILMAVIELIAAVIRIIPSLVMSSTNPRFASLSLPFLHVGQILNAVCGPLAMAPVSQLSSLWFGTNERTRATTVAIMAYNLGSTLSFPLGPAIVSSPEDIPHLLYIHVGFAFLGCVLTLIYFPAQPLTPPSRAAALLMKHPVSQESAKSWRSYTHNIRICFTTPAFILLVTAAGLISGTFGVWTSLFDIILTPDNYTEQQIGWFGFGSSVAEIVGGLFLASIADMPRFHRSYKILILTSFICYFLSVLWFNLSIHSVFLDKPIIPSNTITIAISATLGGLSQGAGSPIAYESLAEIMYPLPESLSASILVQLANITSLILFFIAPDRYKILNLVILIIIFLCIILSTLTPFAYKRRDAERTRRKTSVAVSTDLADDGTGMSLHPAFSPVELDIDSLQMDPIRDTLDTKPIIHQSD